jgi:hypothetical protein
MFSDQLFCLVFSGDSAQAQPFLYHMYIIYRWFKPCIDSFQALQVGEISLCLVKKCSFFLQIIVQPRSFFYQIYIMLGSSKPHYAFGIIPTSCGDIAGLVPKFGFFGKFSEYAVLFYYVF